MEITDIRVKLVNHSSDRLKAFCSVTLDEEFVIRDIKLVEGANGLFVAMPSRKLTTSCPECRHKNPLRARYCADCGAGLPSQELPVDDAGRLRLYRDIAHPITQEFREKLQESVVEAFRAEYERAADPDYEPDAAGVIDEFEEDGESQTKNKTETEETTETEDAEEIEETEEVEEIEETTEAAEPSEYNALIAGLNQGEKTREPHRPQGRDSDHRRDDHGPAKEGQRPRRRGGRGRRPRADRASESKPRSAPVAEIASERDAGPDKPIFEEPDNKHRDERPAHPVGIAADDDRDRVTLNEVAEQPSEAEVLDDSVGFGAGIL